MADRPTFKDIVEFAKAGWKPAEVKELLESASKLEDAKPDEKPAEISPKEDVQPEQEKPENPKTEEDSKEDIIKNLQKQLEEMNQKLAAAQQGNQRKDIQTNIPSEQEILEGIARNFM